MTDEFLLKRLRIGWHDDDTPIWVSDAMVEAADRIEQLERELSISRMAQVVMDNGAEELTVEASKMLTERDYEYNRKTNDLIERHAEQVKALTAERDKYEAAWMTAEGKLSDADAMIEAQAKDHASNNIRFAEATHRITVLTEKNQSLALDHLAALGQEAEQIEVLMAERERDTHAHKKEIAVWSENYAALERKVVKFQMLVDAVRNLERMSQTQMRTADFHSGSCKCFRCAEDNVFAALAALNTGKADK